jgi:hypothetical protein
MSITNAESGTNVHEIAAGIYRINMDYFSHTKNARALLEVLASTNPTTLACMHGSAWRGDGAKLILALADSLEA